MGLPQKQTSFANQQLDVSQSDLPTGQFRKYLALFLLSFSSGLPVPLISATLQAWLTSEKISLTQIGLFSAATVPYGLRFLWAPLVDRFSLPLVAERKGWIVSSQLALIVSLCILAFRNPNESLGIFFLLALLVGFLGATQDIAIDALRAEILSESERGPGSSASVTGSRLAFFISGAVALILADHFSWKSVYLFMAGLVGVGIVGCYLAPTLRSGQNTKEPLSEVVTKPFKRFFSREDIFFILATIVLYKIGFAMANSMSVPFFLNQGFSKTDIGTMNKTLGLLFTVSGAFLGGLIIKRSSISKALYSFGWFQLIASLVFAIVAALPPNIVNLIVCVVFDNFCGGMATAALFAFILSKTNKDFIATQMSIMGSVLALTRTFGSMPTGYIIEKIGWVGFFILTALVGLPALVLLRKSRLSPNR